MINERKQSLGSRTIPARPAREQSLPNPKGLKTSFDRRNAECEQAVAAARVVGEIQLWLKTLRPSGTAIGTVKFPVPVKFRRKIFSDPHEVP
jgi:hypothetical protein